ncbi:hypothetical protein ACFLTD_03950, partial [Elusimicrobiota bacterium]
MRKLINIINIIVSFLIVFQPVIGYAADSTDSVPITIVVGSTGLATPVISSIPSPDNDGNYQVDWNDIPGAVIYQLQESTDPDFNTITADDMVGDSYMGVFGRSDDTYYYRVAAWDNTNTSVGNSSAWSTPVSVTVTQIATPNIFTLGTKDNSEAEFLQDNYVADFFPDTQPVGELAKEVSDWYTQYIHFGLTSAQAQDPVTLILDPAWNNGTGALKVAVEVYNQNTWVTAGTALINATDAGYVDIMPSFLKSGINDIRIAAVMSESTGGTTSITWDQIICEQADYTAVWTVGVNDESDAELDQEDFMTGHFNPDTNASADFPKELNTSWWNYQYIDFSLNAAEAQKAAVLTLDTVWNDGTGTVTVDIERWDGSSWVTIVSADLGYFSFSPAAVNIPVYHIKEGLNEWRIHAVSGTNGTTTIVWDSIRLYQRAGLPLPVADLLGEILDTSINYYLTAEAIHASGLPLTALKIGDRARYGYSNPTEWGYAIQAWIVAAERGIITDTDARSRIDNALNTMRTLQQDPDQFKYGLFYPYYTLIDGSGNDVAFPYHDSNLWLPSGDCALLYGSLNVAEGWLRFNAFSSTADKALAVKNYMDFSSCYYEDPAAPGEFYIAHIIHADTGELGSAYEGISKWNIYADEGGMVAFIAYLSGSLSAAEYQNVLNSQMRNSATWNGHYVQEAAWFNAMFTWAQRSLVGVPMLGDDKERIFGINSFMPNVTAHLDYADLLGIDYPGFSDAMTQSDGGQALVGRYTPPNLYERIPLDVPEHIMPHAFSVPFCALDALDEGTLKRLVEKWVLLKCDTSGVWHPDGTQDPYGFEVLASPFINQTYDGADAGRYIFENLSQSYLALSIYEGLARCGNGRTFNYYTSQLPGYNDRVADIMNMAYGSGIVTTLDTPVIDTLASPNTTGDYQVNWNDISGAVIYQLQESSDPTFGTGTAEHWLTGSYMDIYGKDDGTYYYRVKAWDNTDTGVGNSSAWSTAGSITVAASGTTMLIDNFEDGTDPNLWGGNYGVMNDFGGLTVSYDGANGYNGSVNALALDFNVAITDEWSGMLVMLSNDVDNIQADISAYEYLTFQVKGSVANIPVKIGLENASSGDRNKANVYVNDYLDGGVTTSYQEVRIPLDAFANLDDLSNMKVITFVFENGYATANGAPVSGILYIDDIGFGSDSVDNVRIDHFGDNYGPNALGGNMGDMAGGTASHSSVIATLKS